MGTAAKQDEDPLALIRDRDLFGDLIGDPCFTTAYTASLASLHGRGARATLEARTGADGRPNA